MKLLSLNTWGASQGQVFFDFIKQQVQDTDIFCFQEIFEAKPPAPQTSSGARMRLFGELREILQEFEGIFTARSSGYDFNGLVDFPVKHGLAVFIRKNVKVANSSVINMGPSQGTKTDPAEGNTIVQVLNLALEEKTFSVINYHGPAQPGDKLDTPERIANSEKLKSTWENLGAKAKILCGDFNLMPETQSIKMLGKCGRDLIKEFKITNTRNEISWKKYNNKQSYADFMFVSPEIRVKNFQVPHNLVSDHLPMVLEFELDA